MRVGVEQRLRVRPETERAENSEIFAVLMVAVSARFAFAAGEGGRDIDPVTDSEVATRFVHLPHNAGDVEPETRWQMRQ
jgi:hypothetical protein